MIYDSNEESEGDGQAAYPPGVVGMERDQEKGTGGLDPWIRTGIGVYVVREGRTGAAE